MTVEGLYQACSARGIRLFPDGDRLGVSAPSALLTPAVVDTLTLSKPSLLSYLRRKMLTEWEDAQDDTVPVLAPRWENRLWRFVPNAERFRAPKPEPTPRSPVDDEYRDALQTLRRDALARAIPAPVGGVPLAPGHTALDPNIFVCALLTRLQAELAILSTVTGNARRTAVEGRIEGFCRDLETMAFWYRDYKESVVK